MKEWLSMLMLGYGFEPAKNEKQLDPEWKCSFRSKHYGDWMSCYNSRKAEQRSYASPCPYRRESWNGECPFPTRWLKIAGDETRICCESAITHKHTEKWDVRLPHVLLFSIVFKALFPGYSKETIPMSYFLILTTERNNIKWCKEGRVAKAGNREGLTFLETP